MATKWTYTGFCTVPDDVNAYIKNAWVTDLKAQQTRIFAALTTKISNKSAFLSRVSTPAYTRYSAFISTVGEGWDRDTILMKLQIKLAASYDKWLTNVTAVFGDKGTFSTTVDAKSAGISNLKRTIAVVGQKSFDKWGAASNAVLLLRGDSRPLTYIASPDTFAPNPEALETAFDPILGALLSPALIAEMVYAAVMAQYADEAGLDTLRDEVLTDASDVLDPLMLAACDTEHDASSLVMSWDAGEACVKIVALCDA